MGNAQSAQAVESHGRLRASQPQRLSKPKVGNPSASASGPRAGRRYSTPGSVERTSSVPAVPSVNVEFVNHAGPRSPTAEQLNKQLPPLLREPQDRQEFDELQEKKMSRRLSVFRSRSSSREPGASRLGGLSRRGSIFGSRKNKTDESQSQVNSRVTSRANSIIGDSGAEGLYSAQVSDGWPPNGSRTSWNYDLNSYEARRLLNLVEQPMGYENSTAMSESRQTVESDNKSSSAAQADIAPISRVNSDVSLYAPVRRRSIVQVPGVATRRESFADNSSRPNFRHSLPATPSMSRQASFESTGSRHLSLPPPVSDAELAPRVLTPNDGEYQSTGAFKFGSLKIVNGVASPAPSPEPKLARKPPADQSSPDYFTRPRKLLSVPAELSPVNLQVPSTSTNTADSENMSKNHRGEYLPNIQVSPFKVAEPPIPSPVLKTTSKHTALEDDLFEDEAQLEFASREVLDVRLDPNAKSDGKQSQITTNSLARSDSGFVPSPTSEYSLKPLSKADSGYSSNVSLRSLRGSEKYNKGKIVVSPISQGPASPQSSGSQNSVASPVSTQPSRNQSATSDRKPVPPPKDHSTTPVTQSTKDVPNVTPVPLFSKSRLKKRPSPTPISTTRFSPESSLRSPSFSVKSPASVKSAGSGSFSNSSLSVGSGVQKKSKFHRVFSLTNGSQRGPPATHTTHVEDQSGLPSIPPNVEERLHQHVGLYPSAPKRLALRTQRSKDTLRTIFSVGSLEFHNMDPDPAGTPVAQEEPAPEPPVKTQPARYRQSLPSVIRKPIARKPVPSQDANQAQAKITSPGSHGASPYDAACSSSQASRGAAGRAMSMTTQSERTAALKSLASRRHSFSPNDAAASPVSPGSHGIVPELAHLDPKQRGRTPPPVAMRTQRTPSALRVPQPLRSKSTPPTQKRPMVTIEEMKALGTLPMPSKTPQVMSPTQTGDRRQIPIRDPRMGQGSFVRAPSREPSPGPSSSRRNSLDQSRHNSLSSQSQAAPGPGLQRPASSMTHRNLSNAAQQLRHRASYDGFSNPNRQSWAGPGYVQQGYMWQQQQLQQQMQQHHIHLQQQQHFQQRQERQQQKQQQVANVFLQQNGVPFVPQGMNINHQKISQPSWEQGGRYPSAFPRGHHRHKSLGNPQTGAVQAPFRVLHSYNSPAYRGVPIWG